MEASYDESTFLSISILGLASKNTPDILVVSQTKHVLINLTGDVSSPQLRVVCQNIPKLVLSSQEMAPTSTVCVGKPAQQVRNNGTLETFGQLLLRRLRQSSLTVQLSLPSLDISPFSHSRKEGETEQNIVYW